MHERRILYVRRRAAVAPSSAVVEQRAALPSHVDAMGHDWARWYVTRHYGPNPRLSSVLGRLRTVKCTAPDFGPGIFCSREAAVFNMALQATSPEDLGRFAFEAHYLHRARPIKTLCAELGISRPTWYRARNAFAERVYADHLRLLETIGAPGGDR